jgi:hypothetical protein
VTRPPPPAPAVYTEAHSALNSPLLARYLLAPAAAETAFLLAGLTTGQQWFFVFMGWLIVPVMIWTTLLYRNWPTGIRLDQTAVSIGAIGSTRAGAGRPRSPTRAEACSPAPGRPCAASTSSPTGLSCGR